jgi:hypothetical protein
MQAQAAGRTRSQAQAAEGRHAKQCDPKQCSQLSCWQTSANEETKPSAQSGPSCGQPVITKSRARASRRGGHRRHCCARHLHLPAHLPKVAPKSSCTLPLRQPSQQTQQGTRALMGWRADWLSDAVFSWEICGRYDGRSAGGRWLFLSAPAAATCLRCENLWCFVVGSVMWHVSAPVSLLPVDMQRMMASSSLLYIEHCPLRRCEMRR